MSKRKHGVAFVRNGESEHESTFDNTTKRYTGEDRLQQRSPFEHATPILPSIYSLLPINEPTAVLQQKPPQHNYPTGYYSGPDQSDYRKHAIPLPVDNVGSMFVHQWTPPTTQTVARTEEIPLRQVGMAAQNIRQDARRPSLSDELIRENRTAQPTNSKSNIHFVMHVEKKKQSDTLDEEDDMGSAAEEQASFETKDDAEFRKSLSLVLPVRVLAYKLGLNTDPQKGWRYRDIKRLLFDNIPESQLEFIKKDARHKILVQRLPNRLTMEHFCRRLLLLVFHFVLRDGREPKFWRRDSTRRDIVDRVLKETTPSFLAKANSKVAERAFALIHAGETIERAIDQVLKPKSNGSSPSKREQE
jgi:hypothetical protein